MRTKVKAIDLDIFRIAAVVIAAVMIAANAPSFALAKNKELLNRPEVLRRAKTWTKIGVPYSQTGYRNGYRRDCSGFVAMAYNLPENIVTWNTPTVAKRIGKNQLKPGDLLLNTKGGVGGRHVVIFERWANKKKTRYVVLEQVASTNRATRRVMPYPYSMDKKLYKPYRFVGMKGYWKNVPKSHRQPVKGYKADPKILAKAPKAASKPDAEKTVKPEVTPKPEPKKATEPKPVSLEQQEKVSADLKIETAERNAGQSNASVSRKLSGESKRTDSDRAEKTAPRRGRFGQVLRNVYLRGFLGTQSK